MSKNRSKTGTRWAAAGLSAAVIALGALAAVPAVAQDSDPNSSDQKTQADPQYTTQQLKQFVTAQNNVQKTQGDWQDKIADAEDKQAAKENANKALVEAVKSSGLSVETYNGIARAAQKSPALTKRIQAQMVPQ